MDKPTADALLSQTVLRKVFDRVVNTRPYIRFSELAQQASRDEVSRSLEQLKATGLIVEHPRPIQDFNTYHASARGIGAHRLLCQFENQLARF